MRQPNFGGPRGQHAQAGFQKVDRQTRSMIWRMARLVLSDYKLSIGGPIKENEHRAQQDQAVISAGFQLCERV